MAKFFFSKNSRTRSENDATIDAIRLKKVAPGLRHLFASWCSVESSLMVDGACRIDETDKSLFSSFRVRRK